VKIKQKQYWPFAILCLLLLGAFVIVLSMRIPTESDFYQHLTHGQDFIANPVLSAYDHWSYTDNGGRWIRWTFGYALLLALVYPLFGVPAIWALQVLALLVLLIILWRYRWRTSLNIAEASLVFALVFAAMQFRFNFRAENFAYIFFAITLIWLYRALNGQAKTGWTFILFLVFWQFFQNSVYLALVPFSFFTVLSSLHHRNIHALKNFVFSLIILLFAHPDSYNLHVRFFQGYEFHKYFAVHELKSPLNKEHIYFWIVLFLGLFGFLQSLKSWQPKLSIRPGFSFLLVCFSFFTISACFAARAVPFALIASMPFVLRGTDIIVRGSSVLRIPFLLFALFAFTFSFIRIVNLNISPGLKLHDKYQPEKVADFILREKPPGNLLHPIYSAGYFLWRFQGSPQVMFDFRLDLYLDFIKEFTDAEKHQENFSNFLKKYNITHAIIARVDSKFLHFRNWNLVYRDNTHDIRVDPACKKCADIIRRNKIPDVDFK